MHVPAYVCTRFSCEWLIRADIIYVIVRFTWIPVENLGLIHASRSDSEVGLQPLASRTIAGSACTHYDSYWLSQSHGSRQ